MDGPELVVLFADADAERLVTRLIVRGIERGCLRPMEWRAVREPMRDARVVRDPIAPLGTFLRAPERRFLVLWDHEGSGRERDPATEVAQDVVRAFVRAGVEAGRVAAFAFEPELEVVLEPVWDEVSRYLAQKRGAQPVVTLPTPPAPKERLGSILHTHKLRAGPGVFEELGANLPLSKLKSGDTLGRVAAVLVDWFGSRT